MGTIVRIPKKALTRVDVAPVCLVTGATEGVTYHRVTFSFVPLWARLSIVFCGLVGIVLMLVTTQRVEAELPFGEGAFAAWTRAKRLSLGLVLGSIALLFLPLLFARELMLVAFVAFLAVVIGAVLYSVQVTRRLGPVCKSIDDHDVELELPSEAAAAAIRKRLGVDGAGLPLLSASADAGDRYDQQLQAELDRM